MLVCYRLFVHVKHFINHSASRSLPTSSSLLFFSTPAQCWPAGAPGRWVSGWLPRFRCTSERHWRCGIGSRPPEGWNRFPAWRTRSQHPLWSYQQTLAFPPAETNMTSFFEQNLPMKCICKCLLIWLLEQKTVLRY